MKLRSATACLVLSLLALPLAAAGPMTAEPPLLFDGLTAGDGRVVFAWAGDLWSVPAAGGEAARLTTSSREDGLPALSPDGRSLAFTRSLPGGNFDVFVLPLGEGGLPAGEEARLTWHPKIDWVRGWTPDGESVVFASSREGDHLDRLFRVPAAGGFPEPLSVPRAYDGEIGRDGRLAYVPWSIPREVIGWSYYRGGLTSPLRLVADGDDREVGFEIGPGDEGPTGAGANHLDPTWLDGALYFRADPDGVFDLFRMGANGHPERVPGALAPGSLGLTHLAADASTGQLVLARDGRLFTLDPASADSTEVPITIRSERHERAPRSVPAAEWVRSVAFGPDGALVAGARGEVVVAGPGVEGGARNLTRTPGVAERSPVLSPNGRRVAAFSDASGEYALEIRSAATGEIERTIPIQDEVQDEADEGPSFYRELTWSPDGRRLAFSGLRLALRIADLDTGSESGPVREIDRSTYMAQGEYHPRWSSGGRYLAYAKALPNRLRAIFVHDGVTGEIHQVTDGTTHCRFPVFDRSGRYLAFVSSSDARLAAASDIGWGLLSTDRAEPLTTASIHVAILREGDRSPLAPAASPEEGGTSSGSPLSPSIPLSPPGARGTPPPDPRSPSGPFSEVTGTSGGIDFEGLSERIVPFAHPAAVRNWIGLEAGAPSESGGTLLARAVAWSETPGFSGATGTPLYRIDLAPLGPGSAPVKILDDVDDFTVSPDGRRLAWSARNRWGLAELAPEAEAIDPEAGGAAFASALGELALTVEPEAEWRQMVRDVWHQARDVFYDPGHHGHDLDALEEHFDAYLPGIATRTQLDALFRTMLGRLSVSHLGVRSGDEPGPPASETPDPWAEAPPTGALGIDLSVVDGHYRIDRIVRSAHFSHLSPLLNPDLGAPGAGVSEGDFLLAIDGEPVSGDRNLYAHTEGKRGRPVALTVASSPDGEDRRTVLATPQAGFGSLRQRSWAEAARQRVEELSGGRLGYVYVPGWGGSGLDDFYRGLLGHSDKEGLIVDTRFNGGGTTADFAIEALARAPLYAYAYRHGEPFPVSPVAFPRPKVLLVNRWNFSAGETFPLMWRRAGLGPIVGTRTGGGGIGAALFQRELVDGGEIRVPNRAAFDPDGDWGIENRGLVPDVVVEVSPADELAGRDPQIDEAVRLALEAIDAAEPREIHVPAYPVHPTPEG